MCWFALYTYTSHALFFSGQDLPMTYCLGYGLIRVECERTKMYTHTVLTAYTFTQKVLAIGDSIIPVYFDQARIVQIEYFLTVNIFFINTKWSKQEDEQVTDFVRLFACLHSCRSLPDGCGQISELTVHAYER